MTVPAEASRPIRPVASIDAASASRPAKSAAAKSTPLSRRLTDLGPRVFSALILAIVAGVTLLSGGFLFLAAWFAASLTVHLEWQRLVSDLHAFRRIAAGSLAILGAALLANFVSIGAALLLLGLGALTVAYCAAAGRRAWSAAGVIYAGSLIISVLALRLSYPFGQRAIGWLFAVVWGTDVIAYFAGRLIGGPLFAPQISPSKTWVGTLCGMIGGALLGSLFLLVAGQLSRLETPAPFFVLFLLGLITSAVAQAGDLFESWTKRCFGAKDSGGLIPGHGGLMDRLDGFIAAALWVTVLGALRGFPSPAEGLFHWL
jgi:phosphatidate cytidylyltransferase